MIHLICMGNPLHSDDGFGSAVHYQLSRMEWPVDVRIFDGTGKNGGLALFEHCDRAIVLEVLPPCLGAPGQILRIADTDYPPEPEGAMAVGTGPLLSAVRRIIHPSPQVEVLGPVAARRTPYSPGVSPLVAAAVQSVTAMLVKELGGKRRSKRRRMSA